MFQNILKEDKKIVVIEEAIIGGGLGSYLLELKSQAKINKSTIEIHGIDDQFINHGTQDELLAEQLLDVDSITKLIKK